MKLDFVTFLKHTSYASVERVIQITRDEYLLNCVNGCVGNEVSILGTNSESMISKWVNIFGCVHFSLHISCVSESK